jgi:5-methylcytosine-specific restriction endonuclease McrA
MEWVFLTLILGVVGLHIFKWARRHIHRLAPRAKRYIPRKVKAYVYMRDGGICQHCGAKGKVGHPLEYDHVKPFSWGGKSVASNLQLIANAAMS